MLPLGIVLIAINSASTAMQGRKSISRADARHSGNRRPPSPGAPYRDGSLEHQSTPPSWRYGAPGFARLAAPARRSCCASLKLPRHHLPSQSDYCWSALGRVDRPRQTAVDDGRPATSRSILMCTSACLPQRVARRDPLGALLLITVWVTHSRTNCS